MRILFVEPSIYQFSGYFRAYNICLSLSKNKIKVDLLVCAKDKWFFKIKKLKINRNLTIYLLPRFFINFYFQGRVIRGLIATFFGIFRKYDIVHVAMPQIVEGTIPAVVLKILGKRIVVDWDDMYENGYFKKNFIIHSYVKIFENVGPRFFGNYSVCSDALEEVVRKRGADKVIKIINGVNLNDFSPIDQKTARQKLGLDPGKKYLLTFGNTNSSRRLHLLEKMFNHLCRLDSNIYLLTNFDLPGGFGGGNVINIGYYNDMEKLGLYVSAADATILILDNSFADRSCYPARTSFFLCGESVIIINDNDSEVTRTLIPFKCTITAKGLKKLAVKTIYILNHPKELRTLKNNSKKAKMALSCDEVVKPLIDYYGEIVEMNK